MPGYVLIVGHGDGRPFESFTQARVVAGTIRTHHYVSATVEEASPYMPPADGPEQPAPDPAADPREERMTALVQQVRDELRPTLAENLVLLHDDVIRDAIDEAFGRGLRTGPDEMPALDAVAEAAYRIMFP